MTDDELPEIDYGPSELWDISERITREGLDPKTLDPAEIEEAACRIAAVIGEFPLRFRVLIEAVKQSASVVYDMARGIETPGRPDLDYRLSEKQALAAAGRFFDAIWRALENDALRPIPRDDDKGGLCPLCLASFTATGTLGQRILPVLMPH